MNTLEQHYILTVTQVFVGNSKTADESAQISDWVKDHVIKRSPQCEGIAQQILDKFPNQDSATNSKRYQFTRLSSKETLLKIVFDHSFQSSPNNVIVEAEKLALDNKPFYPLWKRVCKIALPKAPAGIFEDTLVKIAITAYVGILSYNVAFNTYLYTAHLISARALPFFINHTPIQVIRAGNALWNVKEWTENNWIKILFYTWVAQQVTLQLPRIPYVTAFAEKLSLSSLFRIIWRSPQTLTSFLIGSTFSAGVFVWKTTTDMSCFFNRIAQKGEDERLAISKKKAYEIWKRVVV